MDGVVAVAQDVAAFEEFVRARGDALHRTAYLLVGEHALAEDLVQTALARSWPAWGRIHSSPEAYVRRAMVTTYCSWWRRRWNGEQPTEQLPDTGRTTQHDLGHEVADRLWVQAALAQLPRRQRAVLVLRYLDDLTEQQTAAALGVTVGTVKSQASKALRRLRVEPGPPPTGDRGALEQGTTAWRAEAPTRRQADRLEELR
ncbi:SigE family RNA polymerase sigma factor [Angustibacter aerolatus]